ncbi:MAG: hypothetical protein NTV34_09850 [Proteobacteria bacterium]|nr:hypothetical protein [Pseudomonadota bacterium]
MSMYSKKSLDGFYFRTTGFYIFFIPVKVPYKQIYTAADAAGLKKREAFGPILEWPKMFGFGFIGVEVENPGSDRSDVVKVHGTFDMYEHRGSYKTLGQSYKKIMKEKPKPKEFLNLYLDDPDKVAPDQCRTEILFR